jgi:tetratricopeptide (TPR) repeat protein
MRLACFLAALATGLAGCASESSERAQRYNEDGIHLFQAGDYGNARESFQAAVVLQPGDPGTLYNLGQCNDQLGDLDKAEQLYKGCLERAPTNVAVNRDCRHALIALLVRKGRSAEAAQMVQAWMAQEPNLSSPYAEDGWLWLQSGDLPQARLRFQQALERDPHDTRALVELARIYEAMQRPERALVLYERSLQVDPRQPAVSHRITELKAIGVSRPKPE